MEYIRTEANGQLFLEPETKEYLNIPSCLYGFKNEETTTETALSGRKVFSFLITSSSALPAEQQRASSFLSKLLVIV